MKRRLTRWLMPILRYGLCAAAILYLVRIVPWNDYVTLNDAAKTRVRLLEEHDNELVIADLDLGMIEEVRRVWQFYRDQAPRPMTT